MTRAASHEGCYLKARLLKGLQYGHYVLNLRL